MWSHPSVDFFKIHNMSLCVYSFAKCFMKISIPWGWNFCQFCSLMIPEFWKGAGSIGAPLPPLNTCHRMNLLLSEFLKKIVTDSSLSLLAKHLFHKAVCFPPTVRLFSFSFWTSFIPLQNMLNFCTASPRSLQTLMKSDRRLRRRPTGSRGPTKASPPCPSTCGSTRRTVGSVSMWLSQRMCPLSFFSHTPSPLHL